MSRRMSSFVYVLNLFEEEAKDPREVAAQLWQNGQLYNVVIEPGTSFQDVIKMFLSDGLLEQKGDGKVVLTDFGARKRDELQAKYLNNAEKAAAAM